MNSQHTLLADRHNYFIKLPQPMKMRAREILAKAYESQVQQATDLMNALKLKPKFMREMGTNNVPLTTVEFDGECNVFLVSEEGHIHERIVRYLRSMLKEPGYM